MQLWSTAEWSWGSTDKSSPDAGTSSRASRSDSVTANMEANMDESAPLLPAHLAVSTMRAPSDPLRDVVVVAATSQNPLNDRTDSFKSIHSAWPDDAPTSPSRKFGRKTEQGRKMVSFTEPSSQLPDDTSNSSGPHRWQRATTFRRSSLHLQHDDNHLLNPNHRCLWGRIAAALLAWKHLGREVLSLYHVLQDPRTPTMSQVLPWLIIMLARSPLSPIPDGLPILNVLNNAVLMPGLIWLAVHSVPTEIMNDAKRKASMGPVMLPRNWQMAALIFLWWLFCVEFLLYVVVHAWGTSTLFAHVWFLLALVALLSCLVFVAWLLSQISNTTGEWELVLIYGVDFKEAPTMHWLEDAAPQVSHRRHAAVWEREAVTP